MADSVSNAQTQLHKARSEREQKASDFYQQKINAGRAILQARDETNPERTQAHQTEATPRRQRGPYRAPSR
jgi:hypothetical protein